MFSKNQAKWCRIRLIYLDFGLFRPTIFLMLRHQNHYWTHERTDFPLRLYSSGWEHVIS
jgi:hypothetical protein